MKFFFEIIIFDRNIQFIVDFWKRLNEKFKTHLKWFTTNYSKIDKQTKITNSILKKYFRIYCNYAQNNWYNFLLFVEFETNSISNNSITIVSFLIIKKYISRFDLKFSLFIKFFLIIKQKIKNIDVFVKKIENFQKYFYF